MTRRRGPITMLTGLKQFHLGKSSTYKRCVYRLAPSVGGRSKGTSNEPLKYEINEILTKMWKQWDDGTQTTYCELRTPKNRRLKMLKKLFPTLLIAAMLSPSVAGAASYTCYCASPLYINQKMIMELAGFDGHVYSNVTSCDECYNKCNAATRTAFSYSTCYGWLGNTKLCDSCPST